MENLEVSPLDPTKLGQEVLAGARTLESYQPTHHHQLKFFRVVTFSDTPLPTVSIFMVFIGILLFVSGLLADVQLKNYYAVKDRKTYSIEKIE